ncbi:hypothetical protein DSM112329_03644 [Paraconexibacter sp. AEG42_29]|uniref:PucR C-terminal helix-turn-helix domain-containing protein n=1 Tax=Paraconexibacter sp. AEG42_29 TaxID=2997339 RepID=A0AAU7AZ65_9ACTN
MLDEPAPGFKTTIVALSRTMTTAMFDDLLADRRGDPGLSDVLDAVEARYDALQAESTRTRENVRRPLVEQILDGRLDDPGRDTDEVLGYRLAGTHLALRLEAPRGRLFSEELEPLRLAAGADHVLLMADGAQSWIGWLGRPDAFAEHDLARLRTAAAERATRLTVGEPATGITGFRRTREQAREAATVQHMLLDAPPTLWFRDVWLETVLLQDTSRARAFLVAQLGQLLPPGAVNDRVCETLLAWLSTGSHVAAAATLGIHENTVRNRLRQAEAAIGGATIQHRRVEIEVALRLRRTRLLDDDHIVG